MAGYSQTEDERICKVFFAYIKTVLYRTARDYIRAESNRRTRFLFLEDVSPRELDGYLRYDSSASETKDNYHIHLQNELLADIIPEFDEKDREILFLLFYEDMTTVEIAELLGISQQAVSKRKNRMFRRLAGEI